MLAFEMGEHARMWSGCNRAAWCACFKNVYQVCKAAAGFGLSEVRRHFGGVNGSDPRAFQEEVCGGSIAGIVSDREGGT
jgi:hypothetical protein